MAWFDLCIKLLHIVTVMSAPVVQPQDCCTPCPSPVVVNVPGPAGSNGTNGTNGTNGVNAYTTLTAGFTQPASGSTVGITVANSSWMAVNENLFIGTGGYYQLTAINSPGVLTVKNLGVTGNAVAGTGIPNNSTVTPTGATGATGATGISTLNGVSPTTSKGDLMVDNGASSPSASDVRLGVGSNGKALVADSTQTTGLNYATITPNTVANSGDVAVFSAASGTPTPVGDSKLFLDATGAPQNINGTFNARGTSAVDLQPVRTNVAHVASGSNATIAGGQDNTASGPNSAALAGNGNTASGNTATISGGQSNTASNNGCTVGGGSTNTASATNATVAGGVNNNASGNYASISGGIGNAASGVGAFSTGNGNTASGNYSAAEGINTLANKFGQRSFSNGQFAAQGDCQATDIIVFNSTTNATPTNLFTDGGTGLLLLPAYTAWAFDGILIRDQQHTITNAPAVRAWQFSGVIKIGGSAATAAIVGTSPAQTDLGHDDVNGSFAVTADTVNGALQIQVTGVAATNYRWAARLRMVELAY